MPDPTPEETKRTLVEVQREIQALEKALGNVMNDRWGKNVDQRLREAVIALWLAVWWLQRSYRTENITVSDELLAVTAERAAWAEISSIYELKHVSPSESEALLIGALLTGFISRKNMDDIREGTDNMQRSVAFLAQGLHLRAVRSLANSVERAVAANTSMEQVLHRANLQANALRRQRAKIITETETIRVMNAAKIHEMLQAETELGEVGVKVWRTALVGVCPICRPMHNVEVPVGALFPGVNVHYPPVHPNCRCTVIHRLPGRD